jgi:hypothetical protein
MENKKHKELINLLIKYQEVVERAFLLKYQKNAEGYKDKGNALYDFDIMDGIVAKEIMDFEIEQREKNEQKTN